MPCDGPLQCSPEYLGLAQPKMPSYLHAYREESADRRHSAQVRHEIDIKYILGRHEIHIVYWNYIRGVIVDMKYILFIGITYAV